MLVLECPWPFAFYIHERNGEFEWIWHEVHKNFKNLWEIKGRFIILYIDCAWCTEVGKVTLKSNGEEALSEEFLQKSNGDEALNDVFA